MRHDTAMDPPHQSGSAHGEPNPLLRLLINQFALHEVRHHKADASGMPESQTVTAPRAHTIADIYKCLHQGEFGVGHSIRNAALFGQRLTDELFSADPQAQELVLEDVSLDGSVLRVNLGPYHMVFMGNEASGSALLLQVCLESAELPLGHEETFLATLDHFRELNCSQCIAVDDMVFAFPRDSVELFLKEVAQFIERYGAIPVLSHSEQYKKLNAPSYRVVDRISLENSPLGFLLGPVE